MAAAFKIVVYEADDTRRRYEAAAQRLGQKDAQNAFRRALNHTGAKAFTAVRRAIQKQTSIKAATLKKHIRLRRANYERLSVEIIGWGTQLSLKEFSPKQFRYGVRAKVWGRSQRFPHAFIVPSLGGHVFKRTEKARLPIEKLYGPSIPAEMVKDQSLAAFETAANDLAARAAHEVARLLTD